MAGLYDTRLDLGAVIHLSGLVLFDHRQRFCLDLFIGRETLAAVVTLSSSPYGVIVFRMSGINDSGIFTSAIRAPHFSTSRAMLFFVLF